MHWLHEQINTQELLASSKHATSPYKPCQHGAHPPHGLMNIFFPFSITFSSPNPPNPERLPPHRQEGMCVPYYFGHFRLHVRLECLSWTLSRALWSLIYQDNLFNIVVGLPITLWGQWHYNHMNRSILDSPSSYYWYLEPCDWDSCYARDVQHININKPCFTIFFLNNFLFGLLCFVCICIYIRIWFLFFCGLVFLIL